MSIPNDANIEWCREHRDWLAAWLEKRGIRPGDWAWNDEIETRHLLRNEFDWQETDVWLPTEGDVLEMLFQTLSRVSIGRSLAYEVRPADKRWSAADPTGSNRCGRGQTHLIALLELLKELNGD